MADRRRPGGFWFCYGSPIHLFHTRCDFRFICSIQVCRLAMKTLLAPNDLWRSKSREKYASMYEDKRAALNAKRRENYHHKKAERLTASGINVTICLWLTCTKRILMFGKFWPRTFKKRCLCCSTPPTTFLAMAH
ncbi:hypothetical protein PVAP13_6KG356212 [Panicum virgatum]|uniref:Uncharacterized protein n=1 Tax=Panicum virgatum TaxID=38727 RepID=A0A8T0RKG5_PANVG|nr:hypothetical protein PVAP13_6KG356212 [Panicum virgatum]